MKRRPQALAAKQTNILPLWAMFLATGLVTLLLGMEF